MGDNDGNAQLDTGNTGGAIEDQANKWLGDMSDDRAVFWYGVFSLIMGASFITLYILLNNNYMITAYAQGFFTKAGVYTAAGLSWIMVSMFDSEMMRGIHSDIVYMTVISAFALQWIDLIRFVWAYDGSYSQFGFWGGLIIYFVFTVAEQILQILFVPRIERWSDTAEINDNGADNNLITM